MLSKMLTKTVLTPVDDFFLRLAQVIDRFREPLNQLRKFKGRKPCKEAIKLQHNFFCCVKMHTRCSLRMANVLAKHFFRGHGGKTENDREVIRRADDMLKTFA